MNNTTAGDSDSSKEKLFVSSLEEVAEQLEVSFSTVRSWRDDLKCPVLQNQPYNIPAVHEWLDEQIRAVFNSNSEIERRNVELEVGELERKGSYAERDEMFWRAVVRSGIAISREIRQWIKDNATILETNPLPKDSAGQVRILQISDVHLTRLDEILRRSYLNDNTNLLSILINEATGRYRETLKKVFLNSSDLSIVLMLTKWVVQNRGKFDIVIITGDLADSGSQDDLALAKMFIRGPVNPHARYETVASSKHPSLPTIADLRGSKIPIISFPGNHDHFNGEKRRIQTPSKKTHWHR